MKEIDVGRLHKLRVEFTSAIKLDVQNRIILLSFEVLALESNKQENKGQTNLGNH